MFGKFGSVWLVSALAVARSDASTYHSVIWEVPHVVLFRDYVATSVAMRMSKSSVFLVFACMRMP